MTAFADQIASSPYWGEPMFGRRVLVTTLDPLPQSLRTVPGVIAINRAELAGMKANDGHTFKRLMAIVIAEDSLELEKRHGA